MPFQHDNLDDLVDNFDYPKPLNRDPNVYGLLGVFGEETNRLDLDIEHLYDQRFIKTATGRELEKLAEEVGLNRRDGESDEHLRGRIYGEYAALRSDGTYDSVASVLFNITDAQPDDIEIDTPPQTTPKTIDVYVESPVLDSSVLTVSEIESILNDAISADASATLLELGTFGFSGSTETEGFNQGSWSSSG